MITKWIVWCSHKSLLKFSHADKEAHMRDHCLNENNSRWHN